MSDLVCHELGEEWRPVVGYEGLYDVSSFGRVRSYMDNMGGRRVVHLDIPVIRTPKKAGSRGQYRRITLGGNGGKRSFYIHDLVCTAFHGPRPAGQEVAHEDGDGLHNTPDNLSWKTRSENHADKKRHGTQPLGEKMLGAKLSDNKVREIRATGGSPTKLARAYDVSENAIRQVLGGKTWKHV